MIYNHNNAKCYRVAVLVSIEDSRKRELLSICIKM